MKYKEIMQTLHTLGGQMTKMTNNIPLSLLCFGLSSIDILANILKRQTWHSVMDICAVPSHDINI